MIGWAIFAIMAFAVLGLLAWPVKLGKPALMLVAAALFTAAAGYAWQGEPGLPGAPAADKPREMAPDTLFASERMRSTSVTVSTKSAASAATSASPAPALSSGPPSSRSSSGLRSSSASTNASRSRWLSCSSRIDCISCGVSVRPCD